MKKRIMRLGSILMVAASPLFSASPASASSLAPDPPPGAIHLPVAFHPAGQIIESLFVDTPGLLILDTRQSLKLKPADGTVIFGHTPAFDASRPLAPVPEPMHYALMGLGLVGLYLARRDRLGAK